MPTGPPDPSPPVEADFRPSHDSITAELLDLTSQFLTHGADGPEDGPTKTVGWLCRAVGLRAPGY